MARVRRLIERSVTWAGRGAAVLMLASATLQVGVLAARKAGLATIATQELVALLAGPAVLLSIPWALQQGRHVTVDAFATRYARVAGLLLALVLGLVLLWFCLPYAWAAFAAGEGSADFGGIGGRWIAKAVLPLFALLLAVQAAARLLPAR